MDAVYGGVEDVLAVGWMKGGMDAEVGCRMTALVADFDSSNFVVCGHPRDGY